MNGLNDFKILVVDDEVDLESLVRQKFRKQIREGKYHFVFALNGVEALAKIIEYPEIGIVLSDINMPEMDGLTLLARLKELKNNRLKTVIVSAYGDMDNIREAMNRGAFDFITKPINFTDLEITIEKTIEEVILMRHSIEVQEKLISIQQDLNTAREIQQAILPKIFPPFPEINRFDIFASMVSAKEVGGDFFDFFLIDSDRLGFVVGDVSGKGVPAAIFMAITRTLIRASGIRGASSVQCIATVNRLLCKESASGMFVTVFYGILNFREGLVEYVNAGHSPPYVISESGIKNLEMTGGLALGVSEDFEFKSKTFRLNPGEQLFLFSDGVTEAFNANNEEFGEKRLFFTLSEKYGHSVDKIVEEILKEVNEFSTGVPQSDDITLLAITYKGE
jgi:phosphoserine phosphatase RsbU/P